MNIIFESHFYPEVLEAEFKNKSKVTLDYAAHNFSKAIFEGLKENKQDVYFVNLPNIGSFPTLYKRAWVKGGHFNEGISLGFCNISYLKRYSIKRRLFKAVKKSIAANKQDEKTTLLLYNFRCLSFVDQLKKEYPSLKVCMIVTDLPEYMVRPRNMLFGLGRKIIPDGKDSSMIDVSQVDGFILLAPQMAERIRVGNKPWVQVEGIYEAGTEIGDVEKEKGKVILYTGNLSKRYGIINLLDAFEGITDKDYKLWLRGSGDCQEEIIKRSKRDSRITLLPPLTREELLKLQKQSTVLVNPVGASEAFTNYFFPSKTLEYLASGTPVVMYHLNCLPKEYDKHIYYIEEDSVEGIRKKLIEICNKPICELKLFGKEATQFIYDNKTPKPQMKKVIDFINSL